MKLAQITEVRTSDKVPLAFSNRAKTQITPQEIIKNYGPAVKLALDTTSSKIKRLFRHEHLIRDDIRSLETETRRDSVEFGAEMRFGANGDVWNSRPGEEDDDHPEANRQAFKKMDDILQAETKALSKRAKLPIDKTAKWPKGPSRGKLRATIGGEEKGWVTLHIEIGI